VIASFLLPEGLIDAVDAVGFPLKDLWLATGLHSPYRSSRPAMPPRRGQSSRRHKQVNSQEHPGHTGRAVEQSLRDGPVDRNSPASAAGSASIRPSRTNSTTTQRRPARLDHATDPAAARIGEVSGGRAADFDTKRWFWTVRRETTTSPGELIDKGTLGLWAPEHGTRCSSAVIVAPIGSA